MNVAGLRGPGKLSATLLEADKKKVDILLIQEHNLTQDWENRVEEITDNRGYHACIGYVTRSGGAAIFIRKQAFPMKDEQTVTGDTALGGRVATMTIPMPSGRPLKVASMYVPAQAQDRERFIRKLALTSCLEGTEVLGTDANCVPNVSIDVRRNANTKSQYSNLHARKLENHLASLGMRDTYRFMIGNLRSGFTRECPTIATRLDRIYSRATDRLIDWLHIKVNATFLQIVNPSDHRAVDATFQIGSPPRREKAPPRVRKHIYHQEQMREAIQALTTSFHQRYPPAMYGTAETHELLKEQIKELALSMQRPAGGAGAATLLERSIQKIATSDKMPEAARHITISKLKEGWNKAAKGRKEIREAAAHSRLEAEERCTKRFHARFKSRMEKREIQELYRMEGTEIKIGAEMAVTTDDQ